MKSSDKKKVVKHPKVQPRIKPQKIETPTNPMEMPIPAPDIFQPQRVNAPLEIPDVYNQ